MANYELRQLKSSDVFTMTKIISKLGVKDFGKCFDKDSIRDIVTKMNQNGDNSDAIQYQIGIDVIMNIVGLISEKLPSVEKDLYKFLSDLSGMTEKNISDLPMNDFIGMIIDVIKKDEFADFIKVVSRLFN